MTAMTKRDYSKPDPALIERVRAASDDELAVYLENAKRKLPDTIWLVDVISEEQVKRGGIRNLTADSVRRVILDCARRGHTCTYKAIAVALGVPWEQAHWRLPKILGDVSEMEDGVGRPLLTAIVTSQKGVCGEGFFEMARRIGHEFSGEAEFQRSEQQRVFDYWRER